MNNDNSISKNNNHNSDHNLMQDEQVNINLD